MTDKERLQFLLNTLRKIPKNKEMDWFWEEVGNLYFSKSNENTDKFILLKKDTEKLKEYLNIKPELSIDYSYIEHTILRKRLERDNIKMENIRLDVNGFSNEDERMYYFILYAFYQIENLINYYFFIAYKNNLPEFITLMINQSGYKTNGKEKNVGDVPIFNKIISFNKIHFPFLNNNDFTANNIDCLRQIRNESSHRFSVIKYNKKEETEKLYKFIQYVSFDSITTTINRLNDKIKELLTTL